MNKRERIIELGADISSTRTKLASMEAEMDSLLTSEPATVAFVNLAATNAFADGTLTDRVIRFLTTFGTDSFTAVNVATALQLPADRMSSLRSTLVRLVEEKRIDRPEPGKYRARQEENAAA